MEENLIQLLSQYGIVGLLCYFGIKEFFSWLGKNGKKNGSDDNIYSKILAEKVGEIASNHLNHLEEAIKNQTQDNSEWHRKQYEMLCQIAANTKK